MKLTEEQVREAVDIKNLVAAYLNFSEKEELIARMKKAGLIEEEKYVIIFEKPSDKNSFNKYTFYSTKWESVDRASSLSLVIEKGSMTMDEIKEVDPRFEAFAVNVKEL